MVIELSGVQFGLKSYPWFENRMIAQREFNLKSQVWFQTKLQDPKFNCHFIRSILKSHNLKAKFAKQTAFLSFIFLQWDWLV